MTTVSKGMANIQRRCKHRRMLEQPEKQKAERMRSDSIAACYR